MKSLNVLVAFVIIVQVEIICALAQHNIPDPPNGAWEWVQTTDVFSQEVTTPGSAGYTMQCSFLHEATPKIFRRLIDEELVLQSEYRLEPMYYTSFDGQVDFVGWLVIPLSPDADTFIVNPSYEEEDEMVILEFPERQIWVRREPLSRTDKPTWGSVKAMYR